jgi:hypothetical protein
MRRIWRRLVLWLTRHHHDGLCGYADCWDVQFHRERTYAAVVGCESTDVSYDQWLLAVCKHGWKRYECEYCTPEGGW